MSNRRIPGFLAIMGAVLLFPSSLFAQGAQSKLATARSIKCTFPMMATSTLKDEQPKPEVKSSKLVLEFEEINADEGSARLKSGFGVYDIVVRYAQGYLHFIQSFRDGPLYVTTILDKESRPGKLKAMHSRHEFTAISLPGFTSSPEQYYGECEIL